MFNKIMFIFHEKNELILTFLLIIFLCICSFFYFNKSFAFHFADEEHNFTIGKYLTKHEILYKDIFTNHQPAQFIISSELQKAININSINMLIKRHRQLMIIYSFLWSLVLYIFFKKKVVFSLIVYELLKIYLLGNLFLAESLTVYPLIFLELTLFLKKTLNEFEQFFIGIISSLCIFMLAPLWPVIALLLILLFIRFRSKKFLYFCFLGFLLVVLILSNFIDFKNYFYLTIVSNIEYTIPSMNYFGPLHITFIKAFIAPLISLISWSSQTPILVIEKSLSVLFILNIFVMLALKRYYLAFSIFSILGFSNLRYYPPGMQYYQGFHSLPWFASFLVLSSISAFFIFDLKKRLLIKLLNIILICSVLVFGFYYSLNSLLKLNNQESDFFINYSNQFTFGEAARIMGNSNDSIYVFPEDWLIYWQSNLNHPKKSFGYYLWLENISELKKNVTNVFNTNPPTFLYCRRCETTDFSKYLNSYFKLFKDGKETDMYVLKAKKAELKESQFELLNFHNFSFN